MGKADKKEQRIRENVNNVSLDDFEALINKYGFIKMGSNHPKAIIGNIMFPYKRENPIKPVYVKGILEIIDNLK